VNHGTARAIGEGSEGAIEIFHTLHSHMTI
jgi:hypothetical protein